MFSRFTKVLAWSGLVLATPVIMTKSEDQPKQTLTYIWGNGYYQARPDALLQFKNF
jgi:hypothetical protein